MKDEGVTLIGLFTAAVERGELTGRDETAIRAVAGKFASVHSAKGPTSEYRPFLRTAFGTELLGYMDGLETQPAGDERIEIVVRWARWWGNLRWREERCRALLGPLAHPEAIPVPPPPRAPQSESRNPQFGEPAYDLARFAIHLPAVALSTAPRFSGPMRDLLRLFFDRYLEVTGDDEVLRVLPPFLSLAAVEVAGKDAARYAPAVPHLCRFAERVIAEEEFDPRREEFIEK